MLKLLKKLNSLKREKRTGWLESGVELDKAEDVAQHTYETVSIVLILVQEAVEEIDTQKVLKMATIHDWPEIVTGDFSKKQTEKIGKDKKRKLEKSAFKKILEECESSREELVKLWEEYDDKNTKEAKLVFVADRLSILLEINHLNNRGIENKKLKKIGEDVKSELLDHIDEFDFLPDLLKSLDYDIT